MNSMMNFETQLTKLEDVLNKKKVQKAIIQDNINRIEDDLKESLETINDLRAEKELIKYAAQTARRQAGEQLSSITSGILDFVFEEGKELDISFNDKDEATISLKKYLDSGEVVYSDPASADGGGYADIVSSSLMIAMLSIQENNKFGIMHDEPTKYLSKGGEDSMKHKRIAEFYSDVATNFEKQVILVSHNDILNSHADKAFRVEMEEGTGISHVTEEII